MQSHGVLCNNLDITFDNNFELDIKANITAPTKAIIIATNEMLNVLSKIILS